MDLNKIYQGDCLEVLKTLPENSVDSIVTDPPYELGFMGKSWDSTGIANNVDMWRECLRVLKPGGHLLSFGGTRTYHRMASAIEDAGFEVRDMIEWVYGSGFPKSLNIGKAVDKLQGNEREDPGLHPNPGTAGKTNTRDGGAFRDDIHITKGTSAWEGWGTALKPAHEPICLARKPISEKTVAENVLRWGIGGIDIDGSRVWTEEKMSYSSSTKQGVTPFGTGTTEQSPLGRFPANLLHDGSDEVKECFPEAKRCSHISKGTGNNISSKNVSMGGGQINCTYGDNGNASRFFKSIAYFPKASKSERNRGCEELEEKASGHRSNFRCQLCGYQKASGTPCKCENPVWEEIPLKPQSNNHPTVKPIALMSYLINMITPKGGTVLDPFAGSGSTLVAAKEQHRNYIGIELSPEYITIAEARLSR